MSENPKDELSAWSVRGVNVDARNAAVFHAKRSKVSVGVWVEQAIRDKIKADRNAGKDLAKRGPVSLAEAGNVIEMLQKLSGAGVEIPSGLQRSAVSMLTKVTKEVSKGQTVSGNGMTTKPDGHADQEIGQSE